MDARRKTAEIVGNWLESGAFPDRELERIREDRAVITEMTLGVVRHFRALEWMSEQLAPREPDRPVKAVLLVGLYQICFMSDVEHYAAVNETVEAGKAIAGPRVAGFLNAVLRRAGRDRETLLKSLARQPVGVRLSHPDVLVERWSNRFGPDGAEALCRWNNEAPRVVITVSLARGTAASYLRRLLQSGIDATPHAYAPHRCIVLPRGVRVDELPGYDEGLFFVQDPSATLAPMLLDPQPGETVLDACAAPGGKALLMADMMGGEGVLWGIDHHEGRMGRLCTNVTRSRWTHVQVATADAKVAAAVRSATGVEGFDRILLDVPCTNTGVIRRRPDARWRFSPESMRWQVETQQAILDAMSSLLKPGGRLVYSTCSLEPEEGSQLVQEWLESTKGFGLIKEKWLVPPESKTDGAYAALLERPA